MHVWTSPKRQRLSACWLFLKIRERIEWGNFCKAAESYSRLSPAKWRRSLKQATVGIAPPNQYWKPSSYFGLPFCLGGGGSRNTRVCQFKCHIKWQAGRGGVCVQVCMRAHASLQFAYRWLNQTVTEGCVYLVLFKKQNKNIWSSTGFQQRKGEVE